MEENTKQQQLFFNKGITNLPSDAQCSDNELSVSQDMIFDSETKPVQIPVCICTEGAATKVLFVHKIGSTVENYIAYYRGNHTLGFFTNNNGQASDATTIKDNVNLDDGSEIQIDAIGKTLIAKLGTETEYFLWGGSEYKSLGNSIPAPTVLFESYSGTEGIQFDSGMPVPNWYLRRSSSRPTDSQHVISNNNGKWSPANDDYQNFAKGIYSEAVSQARKDGLFIEPFLARFAVELFDGSYVNMSAPILIMPCVRANNFCVITGQSDGSVHECVQYVYGSSLRVKCKFDYSDYSDIVRNVTIFMSDFARLNKTDEDAFLEPFGDYDYAGSLNKYSTPMRDKGWTILDYVSSGTYHKVTINDFPDEGKKMIGKSPWLTLGRRKDEDIIKDLTQMGTFYKIAELGTVKDDSQYVGLEGLMTSNILNTLTTQPQLGSDGYFEWTKKTAESMMTYNSRLILANVTRSIFEGYDNFIAYNDTNSYTYDIYVTINADAGQKVAHKQISNFSQQLQYYFYYPDPRAKKVSIYRTSGETCELIGNYNLTESPVLNGAYFLNSLPAGESLSVAESGATQPTGYDSTPENLSNQLYVSEVNNPWTWKASGNLTAGFGGIIGVSSITTALSQGQFGQYPLLIFSSDGIYAASMGSDGVFTAVHPMSREVCNNKDSITQTDGAVFFSTDKGLMVTVGNEVKCVSEQLNGEFPDMLKEAKIAYDYRDSLLWIIPKRESSEIGNGCWLYNIKTNTFHKSTFFMPSGEDVEEAVLPFTSIIPLVVSSKVITGSLDANSLKESLEGDTTPSFVSFEMGSPSIVFNASTDITNGKRFFELRTLKYSLDGENYLTQQVLFTSFDDDDIYRGGTNSQPSTDYKFEAPDKGLYVWDQTNQQFTPYIVPFSRMLSSVVSGRLVSIAFVDDDDTLKAQIEDKYGLSSGFITGLSDKKTEIVYIEQDECFRLLFTATAYTVGSSFGVSLYYSSFSGWELYNDPQTGHPHTTIKYRTSNSIENAGFFYSWYTPMSVQESEEFKVVGVPFHGSLTLNDTILADYTAFEAEVSELVTSEEQNFDTYEDGVVFDYNTTRFYLKVMAVGQENKDTFVYYLQEFDNTHRYNFYNGDKYHGSSSDYVDSNNNYRPKSSMLYNLTSSTQITATYIWDGSNFTTEANVYPYSNSADYSSEYIYSGGWGSTAEEDIQSDILSGVAVSFSSFSAAEVGVVFAEWARYQSAYSYLGQFLMQAHYSYTYQKKNFEGDVYYTDFSVAVDSVNYTQGNYNDTEGNYLYKLNDSTVYTLISTAFSNMLLRQFAGISNVVNAYPDSLFHLLGDGLYSLINRPQPEDDATVYSGVIETRPMKFENALALKTICQVRNIYQMNSNGTISLKISASNNLKDWMQLQSLRGKPWKYYKFRYEFGNLLATDRFSGALVITQERRTNKMR